MNTQKEQKNPLMTSHTPGPWRPVRGLRGKWSVEDEGQSARVAACYPEEDNRTGFASEDQATDEANARLIAAAPDLLAACKIALEVIRRHKLDQYCGEDELTDPDGVNGIGDVLRQAIAKAEETPLTIT